MTDRTVRLIGGPLDGMTFPHPNPDSADPGAYMTVPGEMARAVYEPQDGDDPDRWHHAGWIGGQPGDVPDDDEADAIARELGFDQAAPPPDAADLLHGLDDIAREQGRGEVL